VAWDIFARRRRQQMPIMDVVWPVTALYLGPLGLWGYRALGRPRARRDHGGHRDGHGREPPAWHGGVLSASHCGAGCVCGDIVGGWLVFATGWVLWGERLYAEYVAEFAFAWTAGIAFQYFSIKPMRPELSSGRALREAIKADTLSIVAFQIGMFGWMALVGFVLFSGPLPIDGACFWFMMTIGMWFGFATTYPVNRWLVRVGIKHGM
jgi:hypothetical protein